jgi:hypothetical protein
LRVPYVPAAIVPDAQVVDPGREATALDAARLNNANVSRQILFRSFFITPPRRLPPICTRQHAFPKAAARKTVVKPRASSWLSEFLSRE